MANTIPTALESAGASGRAVGPRVRLVIMRTACTSVLLALSTIAVLAQQPTFRSDTRIVPVLATVHGADGRLVPDLQQEDFTIFDNGRRQEIAVFENSVQPVTVVVMLDFSGSMTRSLPLLKQGAEQFLVRMQAADQGQIGAFSDRITFSGTFTNDRDRLIRALEDLQSGNPTALYDAIDASIDKLVSLDGRRIVLVFTDGEDNFSKRKFKDVRDRARDRDILVYAIGLRSQVGAQVIRPDPDLEKLASSTGGGYFELNAASEHDRHRAAGDICGHVVSARADGNACAGSHRQSGRQRSQR